MPVKLQSTAINRNLPTSQSSKTKIRPESHREIIQILKSSSTIEEAFEKTMQHDGDMKSMFGIPATHIKRKHMYTICCLYRAANKGKFPTSFEQIKTFFKNQYAANKELPEYRGLDEAEKYFNEFKDLTLNKTISFKDQQYNLDELRSLPLISKYYDIEISKSEKPSSTDTITSLNQNTFNTIKDHLGNANTQIAMSRVDRQFYHLTTNSNIRGNLTVNENMSPKQFDKFLNFVTSGRFKGNLDLSKAKWLSIIDKDFEETRITRLFKALNAYIPTATTKISITGILNIDTNMSPKNFNALLNFIKSDIFQAKITFPKDADFLAPWADQLKEAYDEKKYKCETMLKLGYPMPPKEFNDGLNFIKSNDCTFSDIYLSGNDLSIIDEAFKLTGLTRFDRFCQAIEGKDQINKLVLDNCCLTNENLKLLASKKPNLTALYVINNNLGDEAAKTISKMKLSTLYIKNNNISDDGLTCLREMHLPVYNGFNFSN